MRTPSELLSRWRPDRVHLEPVRPAPAARAQVLYGTILGNLQDSSGAALPGATVTITGRETNLTRSTVTNEVGGYAFANVPAGTYDVKAEQGNAGGAAITVVTKSGSNEFKGSAFAFCNNQNFNARPYFATEKPDASSHIDGVTLGGPISRDKLFFFGAWEGQFQRTPQQFFYDVPPAALRAGDSARRSTGTAACRSSTTRLRAIRTAPAVNRPRAIGSPRR